MKPGEHELKDDSNDLNNIFRGPRKIFTRVMWSLWSILEVREVEQILNGMMWKQNFWFLLDLFVKVELDKMDWQKKDTCSCSRVYWHKPLLLVENIPSLIEHENHFLGIDWYTIIELQCHLSNNHSGLCFLRNQHYYSFQCILNSHFYFIFWYIWQDMNWFEIFRRRLEKV